MRLHDGVCLSCGFLFARRVPPDGFLAEYYRDAHTRDSCFANLSDDYDRDYRRTVLRAQLPPPASVLEWGAGTGEFSALLGDDGYAATPVDLGSGEITDKIINDSAAFAESGAFRALLTPASLGVTFLIGPLAALAALQLAVCVSSRVNDPRSAQQIGALVVLPVTAVFVLQIAGMFQLGGPAIVWLAVALAGVNIGLILVGIALFDRESILTRWK